MNKIILLSIGLFLVSCATSKKKVDCDAYGMVENNNSDTTITWNDNRVSHIDVSCPDGITIPQIPVNNSNQLHLNDLNYGEYTITFKCVDTVLYSRTINIVN